MQFTNALLSGAMVSAAKFVLVIFVSLLLTHGTSEVSFIIYIKITFFINAFAYLKILNKSVHCKATFKFYVLRKYSRKAICDSSQCFFYIPMMHIPQNIYTRTKY